MREPQAYDREGMPIYPDWQEDGTLQKDPRDDYGERDLYEWATCGHCGRRWNDALITDLTPAPAARCPFEYDHEYDDDDNDEPTERLKYLRAPGRAAGRTHQLGRAGRTAITGRVHRPSRYGTARGRRRAGVPGGCVMRRTAIYAHAYSCRCDWCGDPIPSCGGGGYDYRPGHDPNMIKYVSAIDGNYVRARLCATHLEKIKRLMETAA